MGTDPRGWGNDPDPHLASHHRHRPLAPPTTTSGLEELGRIPIRNGAIKHAGDGNTPCREPTYNVSVDSGRRTPRRDGNRRGKPLLTGRPCALPSAGSCRRNTLVINPPEPGACGPGFAKTRSAILARTFTKAP